MALELPLEKIEQIKAVMRMLDDQTVPTENRHQAEEFLEECEEADDGA